MINVIRKSFKIERKYKKYVSREQRIEDNIIKIIKHNKE
jgi:hypothetical protein